MVERMKDEQDRELEALFRPPRIDDDGFSVSVVRRIERGLWFQRLALPAAAFVGGAVAVRSIIDLQGLLSRVDADLQVAGLTRLLTDVPPQIGAGLTLAAIALIAMMVVPILED